MGLDQNGVRLILRAARLGVSFERTATLGRQSLDLSVPLLANALGAAGRSRPWATARELLARSGGYAEELFAFLGCRELVTFDASGYEGATVVHDFNEPLPPEFHGRFTAVLDGGSLEHVFNFPTAIGNLMSLPVVGGHYLGISPANNFPGHGFYQFSPELFFRVLAPENGYAMRKMVLFEEQWIGGWKEVSDPAVVRRRVTFTNRRPTYLAMIAERTSLTTPFDRQPLQSDYASEWQEREGGRPRPAGVTNVWTRGMHKFVPGWLRSFSRFPSPLFRRDRPGRDEK